MGDRTGPFSPLTSRASSFSRARSGYLSPSMHSIYTSGSPQYTRRSQGRSIAATRSSSPCFGPEAAKCVLSFPDASDTVAAIEEPLPGSVLATIGTLAELERYWYPVH